MRVLQREDTRLPLAGEIHVAPALPTCSHGTGCCLLGKSTKSGQASLRAGTAFAKKEFEPQRTLRTLSKMQMHCRSSAFSAFSVVHIDIRGEPRRADEAAIASCR